MAQSDFIGDPFELEPYKEVPIHLRHYMGDKPAKIEHVKDEGLSYTTDRQAELDDGDFTDLDNGF